MIVFHGLAIITGSCDDDMSTAREESFYDLYTDRAFSNASAKSILAFKSSTGCRNFVKDVKIDTGEIATVLILARIPRFSAEQKEVITDLTLPPPSAETPLQPSRPRVHATRSPGLRWTFPHPPEVPTSLGTHRSFSNSSTSRRGLRQCSSFNRSSLTARTTEACMRWRGKFETRMGRVRWDIG